LLNYLQFPANTPANFSKTQYNKIPYSNWRDYVDQSVDPCDDFLQFSCGNYLKRAQEDHPEILYDKNKAKKGVQQCLKGKINALMGFKFDVIDALMSNKETNSSAIQKMRWYRDAYLNKENGPKLSTKQLLEEMEVKFN
jgi:hypothetical protein